MPRRSKPKRRRKVGSKVRHMRHAIAKGLRHRRSKTSGGMLHSVKRRKS